MADDIERKYIPPEIKEQANTPEGGEGSFEFAPEGWMTIGAIHKKYVSTDIVREAVNEFRSSRPESFKRYKDKKQNRVFEYFSPEIVRIIEERISKLEKPPVGWLTANGFAVQKGGQSGTIAKVAESYKSGHPYWFKQYRSEKGVLREYYAPELVNEIARVLSSVEKAPAGWVTAISVAKNFGLDYDTIIRFIEGSKSEHPDWSGYYLEAKGKKALHVSPEFVSKVNVELSQYEDAPEGWMTVGNLATSLKIDWQVVKKAVDQEAKKHPDDIKKFRDPVKKSKIYEYLSPQLIDIVLTELTRYEAAPPEWMTNKSLANQLQTSKETVEGLAKKYRDTNSEWFKNFKSKKGPVREFYSPELVGLVIKEFAKFENVPEGWIANGAFTVQFGQGRGSETIARMAEKYRTQHPEWFHNYRTNSGVYEFYSRELAAALRDDTEKEKPPAGWVTMPELEIILDRSPRILRNAITPFKNEHPDWVLLYHSKGGLSEHFSPELIVELKKEVPDVKDVPDGWLTISTVCELFHISREQVIKIVDEETKSHSDWIKKYRASKKHIFNYLSPELIEIIKNKTKEDEEPVENLEGNLKETLDSEVQEFKKLVGLFGASRFADILYINHPQYRGMPVGRVKSVIAEYLGDFLVIRYNFNIADLKGEVKYLSDANLKEGLFEVMKDSCLRFYHEQKKVSPGRNDLEIIDSYTAKLRVDTESFSDANVKDLIEDVGNYYHSLFEKLSKPGKIVESLKKNREFPDINQRLNIKEIEDKKRILIGDEMGLGKSASAILAKECLGVKQALVVTPSNVIDTWKNYLSDLKAEDGTPIGYFKEGHAPRVLVVSNLKSLRIEDIDTFDYILISQEKLTTPYTKELRGLNFGMMVVDEVHKLKNLREGQRSENIVSLSEKVEGEGKYLALLSGTPVPNKVEDVAIILKLLYPEKFKDIDNKDLVRSIIKGDLVDLRALLVPRMQMKNLQESVEMPQLEAQVVDVDLNEFERNIYEVLIEEDEITATQKIQIMRQFLLNPYLIDPTPGIDSSKQVAFRESLIQEFKTKDKVVVFVNGYVEGIIRGEKNILENLGLPPDIEIMVIEGNVSKERRKEIQVELNQSDKKILLFVNGQTADVGVDFTGGEAVDFYNEPWSKYDIAQQLARVYRPGLKSDLTSKTFITRNTIEEGIHQYIDTKQRSIEKLLKGIPITELERELLTRNETQVDHNLEVNPELAEYYFTAWDRMMKIFSEVKEIGEQSFTEYISKYGREYASCYFDLGSRSYQANGSRLVGTVINRLILEAKQNPKDVRILDIASGPEMLKKHVPDHLQSQVYSMDINKYHFEKSGENRIVGSFGKLPIQSNSLDYANLSLALHYTKFIPSKQEFERLEVLMEMNRVLKEGGKAVINLIYSLDLKNEEEFVNVANALGFKIVEGYSGEVAVGRSYRSRVLTLEKERDVNLSLAELLQKLDRKNFEGLKFRTSDADVRDTRKMFNQFQLADKSYFMDFNTDDADVFEEEQAVTNFAKGLKSEYGAIERIPRELVIDNNFVRFFDGSKYILFKKLRNDRGIVVVK